MDKRIEAIETALRETAGDLRTALDEVLNRFNDRLLTICQQLGEVKGRQNGQQNGNTPR